MDVLLERVLCDLFSDVDVNYKRDERMKREDEKRRREEVRNVRAFRR